MDNNFYGNNQQNGWQAPPPNNPYGYYNYGAYVNSDFYKNGNIGIPIRVPAYVHPYNVRPVNKAVSDQYVVAVPAPLRYQWHK